MQKRYRVAYLVSHPIQYQAPMLRYLASKSDIDLTVFFQSDFSLKAYRDPGFGQNVQWDVSLLDGYKSLLLPAIGGHGTQSFFRPFNTDLTKNISRSNFDALWIHGYAHTTTLRALFIAKSRDIPVLIRAESQSSSAVRSPRTARIKETFLRMLFRQSDAFLAIGSRNRDYYRQYGVSPDRIFLMPYAVDNAFFQSKVNEERKREEEFKNKLGLTVGRPVILYASKFIARKRAGDLLEAYIRMFSKSGQEPRPYLLFIGDGEERQIVEERARQTGWDSIRFLGFKNQTELPAYFNLCDVFVLPSEKEPWGLIVNEVMNASKPVIVSNGVGSSDDLVQDGINGFIYPVGNIDALADRLHRVLSTPAFRLKMGEHSRQIIDQWGFKEDYLGLQQALNFVTRNTDTPILNKSRYPNSRPRKA